MGFGEEIIQAESIEVKDGHLLKQLSKYGI